MAETTIDVSEYANMVASEKFFQFGNAVWTPVMEAYNNDPTLMLVKKIVDIAVPTQVPASIPVPPTEPSLEDDYFIVEPETPKPVIKRGSGEGLAKAKAAAAKAMEKPVAKESK